MQQQREARHSVSAHNAVVHVFKLLYSSCCIQAAELVEVALAESSDSLLTAESDEFFEVYSDEFFDCVDPMSRAGPSRGVQARSSTM